MQLILVINPGSTSTKLALFDNHKLFKDIVIRHNDVDLKSFNTIIDQLTFRKKIILEFLKENNVTIDQLKAIVARGGLLKPIAGGTYLINQTMVNDLKAETYGSHASNLGGLLAYKLTTNTQIPAFIVDPVVVDELADIARVSGSALINRKVIFHALNQKAVARRYAQSINKSYNDLSLIVCHMGGGITIG
jgi:butyrate kinase